MVFRGQNEDTQTRKVGWNKYITITEKYTEYISYTTVRNVLPELLGSLEVIGIRRTSNQPDECGTRPFQVGPGTGAEAQTRPTAPKMPCRHSPKKGRLRHQVMNIAPSRRVRAMGTGPWGSRMLIQAHLEWLPLESGHTRPDPRTDKTRPTEMRSSPAPLRE